MKRKPVKTKRVHDTLLGDVVIIESLDDLKRMFLEAIDMENERKRAKKKVAAMKAKPKKKTKK